MAFGSAPARSSVAPFFAQRGSGSSATRDKPGAFPWTARVLFRRRARFKLVWAYLRLGPPANHYTTGGEACASYSPEASSHLLWLPALRLWGPRGQRPTRATSVTERSRAESRRHGRGPMTVKPPSRRPRARWRSGLSYSDPRSEFRQLESYRFSSAASGRATASRSKEGAGGHNRLPLRFAGFPHPIPVTGEEP
jgi:hypothetical protein